MLENQKKALNLQRVFHSIRFKVNKGWGLAKPLFLCRKVWNVCFFFVLLQRF